MITPVLQLTVFFIASYIILISISNPQKGLFLYLSTLTTRLYNFHNFPRLLSPQTLDLIIIILLLFRFSKYLNISKTIKSSKIFLLWVLSHIFIRIIQISIYPDMSFVQTTSDIIGFYLKLYILYLLTIGYLNYSKDFSLINKAILINLMIYFSFIYIEYFFGINYNDLFNTVLSSGSKGISFNFSQRGGLSLIHGPNVHWVSTATFVISNFSVIFFCYRKKINFISICLVGLFLFTIFIIGARSAIISAIITVALYFILDSSKNKRIINILIILFLFTILVISPYGQYIFNSLSTSSSEGLNMSRRLVVQLFMLYDIKNVPIIGYGFMGRSNQDLFQFQEYEEINFILIEIFDFGVIVSIITILFYLSVLTKTVSFKYPMSNLSTYSWIAIILAFISNGNQEYIYYMVPIIFYSYSIWYKQNINLNQKINL